MKTRMLLFGTLFVSLLAACDVQDSTGSNPPKSTEERFHEKSFSWDAPAENSALAKTQARRTRFETEEELGQAIIDLDGKLDAPGFSDSLWKPIDYACDELALAIWNTYGTVLLKDSVVMDESVLKVGCRPLGSDSGAAEAGLSKTATVYPASEEMDRQYPYKMIGRSWDDFNLLVYKSTGGETQFKKNREKFGFTGWYDTDATRIGIRIHLFNCSTVAPRICYTNSSKSDWYRNDDYVSKRETGFGFTAKFTRPTPENNWTISPKGAGLINFKVADGVVSMHSVDHAGLQFRAMSSSGLTPATEIVPFSADYVVWD